MAVNFKTSRVFRESLKMGPKPFILHIRQKIKLFFLNIKKILNYNFISFDIFFIYFVETMY